MSKLLKKIAAAFLAPLMAAGTLTSVAAQMVEAEDPLQPQSVTLSQTIQTGGVSVLSEVEGEKYAPVSQTSDTPYNEPSAKCAPFTSSASGDSGTIGDLTWKYDVSSKVMTISGEGPLYKGIEWKDFDIDKVVVESGVTELGPEAITSSTIKSIDLPDTIAEMGYMSLYGNTQLESVEIPPKVTYIGRHMLQNCYGLKSIKLHENVTAIRDYSFGSCSSLESIELPEGLETISWGAFEGCKSLKEIIIPDTVTDMSEFTFSSCQSLERVKLSSGVKKLGTCAFNDTALKSVVIPEGMESLGDCSFRNCPNLTEVTLPYTINYLGEQVFAHCEKLTNIVVPDGVGGFKDYAFYGCKSLKNLVVPDSVTAISENALLADYDMDISMGETVFIKSLTIQCNPGSFAQEFAEQNNINYEFIVGDHSGIMNVSLDETYVGQKLKVTYAKTGKLAYLRIIDKPQMSLYGFDPAEVYNAQVLSDKDLVFGTINNIAFTNGKAEAEFADMQGLSNLTVSVVTDSKTEITDSCNIMWYTEDGAYLKTGSALENVVLGNTYKYTVTFKYSRLGETYFTPEKQTVTADSANMTIKCELVPIPVVLILGKVTDAEEKPVRGASVSVTQEYSRQNEKTLAAVTDDEGEFTIEAKNLHSNIIVKKQGCEIYKKSLNNLDDPELDITLKAVETVNVPLNITKRSLDSSESEDVVGGAEITVENASRRRIIEGCTVSVNNINLPLNEVKEGEQVKVTVSLDGCGTAESTFVLGTDESVILELWELGRVNIIRTANSEKKNSAIFFDSNGRYVTTLAINRADVTSNGLPEGEYTVILMNESNRYYAPASLEKFGKYGLEENKDYVRKTVTVENGKTSKLENTTIPDLDESKASFLKTSKCGVTINRSFVTIGQYAVVNVDYEFNRNSDVSDINILLNVPESFSLSGSSVTVDNKKIGYGNSDGEVYIPVKEKKGTVRVAIKAAKASGDDTVTVKASFKSGEETYTESIGTVECGVEEFDFYLPERVNTTTVHSFGTTLPNKKVEYYDNDILAGTTYSNKDGSYEIEFELVEPYSKSLHEIYAVVDSFTTEKRLLEYDSNAIVPVKLEMLHSSQKVTINFNDRQESSLYYKFVPASPRFTFVLTVGGDASKVTDAEVRTSTPDGSIEIVVPLVFDEDSGTFVGSYTYTPSTRPVDVAVNIVADEEKIIDYDYLYADTAEIEKQISEYNEKVQDLNGTIEELADANEITKDEMIEWLTEYGFTEETLALIDLDELLVTVNEDNQAFIREISEASAEYCKDDLSQLEEAMGELNKIYESREEVQCVIDLDDSVTADMLTQKGYKQIKTYGDKGLLFEPGGDDIEYEYDFVDLTEGYAIKYSEDDSYDKIPVSSGAALVIEESGLCTGCDHNIIPPSEIANLTRKIAKTVKPAAKWLRKALKLLDILQANTSGFLNSASDTYKHVISPDLGKAMDPNNPHLKALAQSVIGKAATSKEIQTLMKYNAKVQAVLGPLMSLCDNIIKVSDLGDMASRIERIIPQLCKCTSYSTMRIKWAIKSMYWYLSTLAADSIISSIPDLGSLWSVSKMIIGGGLNGIAKTHILPDALQGYVEMQADPLKDMELEIEYAVRSAQRRLSDCKCKDQEPKKKTTGKKDTSAVTVKSGVDPSGYVCEAVASNRIEGVTATLWYSNSSDGTNAIVWDSSEYSQLNPLVTDDIGHYEWFVPEGWWQVRFEKSGYENTASEWVPVLPIQTEVNVSMRSLYAPEVNSVAAYTDGVDITFTQYMDLYSVTNETIKVTSGGSTVSGKIEPLNPEESFDNYRLKYASKFRFVADSPLSGEVSVTVGDVKSYNGLYLSPVYQTNSEVIERAEKIDAPKRVVAKYNEPTEIVIQLLHEKASANVDIKITTDAGNDILTLDSSTITTDANGKAKVTVTGKLPAQTTLTFLAESFDVSASTKLVLSEHPENEPEDIEEPEEPEIIGNYGDIDGDGEITANDALTILRSSVGMANLTPEQNKLADVDSDTEITANDALAVLRYSVGMADEDSPINKPIAA